MNAQRLLLVRMAFLRRPEPYAFKPSILGEFLSRLLCSVDLSISPRRQKHFSRFEFLHFTDLRFDGNRADHRHSVPVVHDALDEIGEELALILQAGAILEQPMMRRHVPIKRGDQFGSGTFQALRTELS